MAKTSVWQFCSFAQALIRTASREASRDRSGCATRRSAWLACRGRGDAHGDDAALIGFEHGEGVAADLELLADERDAVHRRQHEARHGLVVSRGQIPIERVVE